MRTWLILLLLGCFLIVCLEAKRAKKVEEDVPPLADGDETELEEEEDYDDDDAEIDDVVSSKKKSKETIEEKTKNLKTKNAETRKNLKIKPKSKSKKEEEDELDDIIEDDMDEDEPLDICSEELSEPCLCELDEIKCDKVIFKDGKPLMTADLKTSKKKKFTALSVYARYNLIKKLQKGHIFPGHEGQIQQLDFSANRIAQIDDGAFQDFRVMSKLKLSNNVISKVKKSWFIGAESLHQLSLDQNLITQLDDGIFSELVNLKKLTLDGNKIKLKKEIFKGLKNLEELSLDNCDLEDIGLDVFDELINLRTLSLRNNPFVEVPRAIKSLQKLTDLDISGTFIPEFHAQSLKDDHILQNLYMEHMPYLHSVLDCAFCGLQKLERVFLTNSTHLYEIHENAFGNMKNSEGKVSSVKKFYVDNCNISTLSDGLLNWGVVTEVGIGGNPLKCGCDTIFLIGGEFFDFEYTNNIPKCAYPESVRGQPLAKINPTDVCPSYTRQKKTRKTFAYFGTLITLILFGVMTYLAYVRGYFDNIISRFNRHQLAPVSYANLANTEENRSLELDFQPRAEDV